MKCPKCRGAMKIVKYKGVEYDRCVSCHGLWFDRLDRAHLAPVTGPKPVDESGAPAGRAYSAVKDVDCPKCEKKMGKMVDAKLPHVWYEFCRSCSGTFFDAAEVPGVKEEVLMDHLKSLAS